MDGIRALKLVSRDAITQRPVTLLTVLDPSRKQPVRIVVLSLEEPVLAHNAARRLAGVEALCCILNASAPPEYFHPHYTYSLSESVRQYAPSHTFVPGLQCPVAVPATDTVLAKSFFADIREARSPSP